MKKRQTLESLLAPNSDNRPEPVQTLSPQVTSGALKAMGMSLRQMSEDAAQTQKLRDQLISSDNVLEIDPATVDGSFIRDRIDLTGNVEFEALLQSIAETGQQVPILVRPHPETSGRFQVAYGHRRLAALRQLKQPVKAIVRALTDDQLVIAQGKENLERQDLSFIERALFARSLEERDFDRRTIMAALGVAKGDLSTLISVAKQTPMQVIEAVGSAPKIGKPRWLELVGLLQHNQIDPRISDLFESRVFQNAPSDQRFVMAFNHIKGTGNPNTSPEIWATDDGLPVVVISKRRSSSSLTVNEKLAPAFSRFLVNQLPRLYAAYKRERRE